MAGAIGKGGGRGAAIEHGFLCVVANSGRGHDGRFDSRGDPVRVESSKEADQATDMEVPDIVMNFPVLLSNASPVGLTAPENAAIIFTPAALTSG